MKYNYFLFAAIFSASLFIDPVQAMQQNGNQQAVQNARTRIRCKDTKFCKGVCMGYCLVLCCSLLHAGIGIPKIKTAMQELIANPVQLCQRDWRFSSDHCTWDPINEDIIYPKYSSSKLEAGDRMHISHKRAKELPAGCITCKSRELLCYLDSLEEENKEWEKLAKEVAQKKSKKEKQD